MNIQRHGDAKVNCTNRQHDNRSEHKLLEPLSWIEVSGVATSFRAVQLEDAIGPLVGVRLYDNCVRICNQNLNWAQQVANDAMR